MYSYPLCVTFPPGVIQMNFEFELSGCGSHFALLRFVSRFTSTPNYITGMCYTNQFMPTCSLLIIYSGSNDWLNASCTEEMSCDAANI